MTHYIIVKWNESVVNKKEMLEKVNEAFEDVLLIDGVEELEVSGNIINRENRYDVMIKIIMDKKSLKEYDESLVHKKWKEDFKDYIKSKCIFDES